ncbi:unnamed protein product [Strongylus vulgaris]|uniref:Uncharacterized protein n=1 Tax=Strongylus vulgaris TaxID=40348 RepID=A0A3P7JIX4_STRVU|nr:unnamed protein product [Strongylus vulgaris]
MRRENSLTTRLLFNDSTSDYNYKSLEMGRPDTLEPLRGKLNKDEFSPELLDALDEVHDDESLLLEACRQDSLYPVYFEHINTGRMQVVVLGWTIFHKGNSYVLSSVVIVCSVVGGSRIGLDDFSQRKLVCAVICRNCLLCGWWSNMQNSKFL